MPGPSARITHQTIATVAATLLTWVIGAVAHSNGQPLQPTRTVDQFVSVNGIQLHYLDWGGTGESMLFLSGMPGDAHTFDSFAPRFTKHFHVLALTRRGQGQSDKPKAEYDIDTLSRDIKGFLDERHIERVNLVGHSAAGVEMTRFAGQYPDRVRALVYLEAANDYVGVAEAAAEAHFAFFENGSPLAEILRGISQSHPDYSKVTAPALAFFGTCDGPPATKPGGDPALKRYVQLAYEKGLHSANIQQFRAGMKRSTIIVLPDCNHAFFLDPEQSPRIESEITAFLLNP